MDDEFDTPPDSFKGIVIKTIAMLICAAMAVVGFFLAFPQHPDGPLLPLPPVPPRIADSPDYNHCLVVLANDPAAALPLADAWFATGGGDPAAHCLALGRIAAGDTEPAAEMLSKLAASHKLTSPQRAAIEEQASQAWMMAHDPERAYAALTLALSSNPDNIDFLVARAQISVALNRPQDALDDLNRALTLDPSRSWVRVLRGAAWRRMNQLPQAAADMDMVLNDDPDNAGALLERGILHHLAHQDTEAKADWQHVTRVAPNAAEAEIAQHNIDAMAPPFAGQK